MPRRDDGKVDEDRSYGFVVVPCVRRNFPQCRRLSVRDEATRQKRDGTGWDETGRRDATRRVASRRGPRAPRRTDICAHTTYVYAIVPSHPRPSFSHTKSNIPALPPSGYNAILAQARRHLQVARSLGRLDALHRDV